MSTATAEQPVLLRQCNGCNTVLRPATAGEIADQRAGRPLPDVRPACPPCAPSATREDLAVLAAAHIAVRTGAVGALSQDTLERALRVAGDLAAVLRAVRDVRAGADR